MNETHLYQLQYAGPQVINEWREKESQKEEAERDVKEGRENGKVTQIAE